MIQMLRLLRLRRLRAAIFNDFMMVPTTHDGELGKL